MGSNSLSFISDAASDQDERLVALLAVPPVTGLDIIGPASVFESVNRVPERPGPACRVELLTTAPDRIIDGHFGIPIVAHRHYRETRENVDTLLVAGGAGARKPPDDALLAWLQEMAPRVRRLGSVCTGAFLLAAAGLLNNRRATTHWAYAQELASRYPEVRVDPDPIWIQEGNIFTSAGVTAGMDLALALVEEDYGADVALKVARGLVLFLRRPGGQAQFSVSLSAQAPRRNSLLDLQAWIADHLDRNLSVESLAARTAMSPRNFARVFVRELGITPARYVAKARVEAVRRLLETTDESMQEIAFACGFGSAELMRRAFLRVFNVVPKRYREHFRRSESDHASGPAPMTGGEGKG